MLKTGLTGGIGSGKSTVARIFETLGIPVYYADSAAKELMHNDPELRENLIRSFGEASFREGRLDRKYLAQQVFGDAEKMETLNRLVHPVTIRDSENWMQRQTTPYAIKEAALLFESGASENLDFVIGVTAPLPLRLQRVMRRDGISREEVLQRMRRQVEESIKMKLCDAVLVNDEQQPLLQQVLSLHERLLALAEGNAG